MVDAVTSEYIFNGRRRKTLHLTNISDGTGEAAVVKADISALTFDRGTVPTGSAVDMIDYNIQGFTSVRLLWDHTTDDEIATLPAGQGCIDWNAYGGKADPRSAGGTGDIVLTTAGAVSGATYDITIYFRPKA
jgi:hypothetical protein